MSCSLSSILRCNTRDWYEFKNVEPHSKFLQSGRNNVSSVVFCFVCQAIRYRSVSSRQRNYIATPVAPTLQYNSESDHVLLADKEKNHHRIRFFHAGKYLAEETCTLEQYDIPAHACLHCFVTKDLAGSSAPPPAAAQTIDATMGARTPASAPSISAAAEGTYRSFAHLK